MQEASSNNQGLVKEMFSEMVEKKQVSLVPRYYHPDFLLYTNEVKMDYSSFLAEHEKIYATPIQYHVEYDDETWVTEETKLAGRVFITITRPGESPKKIQVILIITFRDNKIYRLWELTYPDWSKMEEFNDFTTK